MVSSQLNSRLGFINPGLTLSSFQKKKKKQWSIHPSEQVVQNLQAGAQLKTASLVAK